MGSYNSKYRNNNSQYWYNNQKYCYDSKKYWNNNKKYWYDNGIYRYNHSIYRYNNNQCQHYNRFWISHSKHKLWIVVVSYFVFHHLSFEFNTEHKIRATTIYLLNFSTSTLRFKI